MEVGWGLMKIRLFGMLKAMVPGRQELDVAFPAGQPVKDLVDCLQAEYPQIGDLLCQKKVVVSVNQEIAHWDTVLQETDEVALLPPFAGGA